MPHAIVMPSFGMYTSEGTLVSWLLPHGAQVEAGRPVLEIETDKATFEVPAPVAGVLHQLKPVGARLTEQGLLGYVLAEGEPAPADEQDEPTSHPAATTPREQLDASRATIGLTPSSPAARRLAVEHGIALARLVGTGPGGRIVEADVLAAVQSQTQPSVAAQLTCGPAPRRAPLSSMRRTIGRRLRRSLDSAVSLTITREVEALALVDARRRFAAANGRALGFDALFVKLLALGLADHPELNAFVDGDELVAPELVNVGVAMAVSDGILVPVIRDAVSKSIVRIAGEVQDFEVRARAGSLRPADVADATTTVTNLGAHGVDAFTPVLNPPQSSILGIGRVQPRPVVRGTEIAVSPTCVLSLTFDHRVADGVPAARLLDTIARRTNDPLFLGALIEERP